MLGITKPPQIHDPFAISGGFPCSNNISGLRVARSGTVRYLTHILVFTDQTHPEPSPRRCGAKLWALLHHHRSACC